MIALLSIATACVVVPLVTVLAIQIGHRLVLPCIDQLFPPFEETTARAAQAQSTPTVRYSGHPHTFAHSFSDWPPADLALRGNHRAHRVHATITAQAQGMPAVRYSGTFDHSFDAFLDARERFPSATRIVVTCAQRGQGAQP
jgi:hypothetical protein